MTELNQLFDGNLAERVFLIASAIFIAFYAGGILLVQRSKAGSRRTVFQAKTAGAALLFALALTAVASGFWRSHATNAGNSPASISPIDLQSAVDMKSLPEQQAGGSVLAANRDGAPRSVRAVAYKMKGRARCHDFIYSIRLIPWTVRFVPISDGPCGLLAPDRTSPTTTSVTIERQSSDEPETKSVKRKSRAAPVGGPFYCC